VSTENAQITILNSLAVNPHGILNLSPRFGKTKLVLDLIKRDKPKKILWVTPNAQLRDVDIPAEYKKWKALLYLKKTDIVCWGSLHRVRGSYDLVVLDEIQFITINNSIGLLNKIKIKYKNIIGLTGTMPKHKEKLKLYQTLRLEVLNSVSIEEAVDQGLIADYNITIVECMLDNKDKYISAGSAAVKFKQTEQGQYDYYSKTISKFKDADRLVPTWLLLQRMRFMYTLKSKYLIAKRLISKLEGRTLIFTGGIPQAEFMCPHYYHSKTDTTSLDKFLAGTINILACVNAGGVGFTYRGVDNFVIVQVDSNKSGNSIQKIARSLVLQDDYKANIYILVVKNTVDEQWKDLALEELNPDKITYISYKNYE